MERAEIFPSSIPVEVLQDPRRGGEVAVYRALRDQLPGFTVFYHCPWYDETASQGRRDGEADFVIAHPQWGLIILEVKGGVVSREEVTRKWRSRDKAGKVHDIKDPVEQAVASKYVILRKIKQAWKGPPPFMRIRHAAVFPESGRPKGISALGADMPLDIFIFSEDMGSLGEKIVHILMDEAADSHTNYGVLGPSGIAILHKLFNQGFELNVSLSALLAEDERRIIKFTEQQQVCLDLTVLHRRALFVGGAGTGKTTLALEKARRLAADGMRVLLVCYNRPLAMYLAEEASDAKGIFVDTFHQFCIASAKAAGLPVPLATSGEEQQFFEKVLPDLLLDSLSKAEEFRFDAVIVDEGQDFRESWWEPLLLTLRGDDGFFYVFMDDNQRIYRAGNFSLPEISKYPFPLTINFRNTKSIFRATTRYYKGSEIVAGGPEGVDLEWQVCQPGKEERAVEKVLNRLINIEGMRPKDIVVLSAAGRGNGTLAKPGTIGRYQVVDAETFNSDKITFDSIFRFKGLEGKAVVIMDIDNAVKQTELMYVGLSRARLLLVVVGSDSALKKLKHEIYEEI